MNHPQPSPRLRALVDRHLDGSLTRVEMAEFEDLLRDPAALDYFLQASEIEAGLHEAHGQPTLALAPAPVPAPSAPLVAMPPDDRKLLYASAAAVALLLVALGAAFIVTRGSRDTATAAVVPAPVEAATLGRTIGLRSAPARALRTGERLTIGSGLAEFDLAGGPRLLVEGPAEFSFPTPDRLAITSGRFVLRVPHGTDAAPFHVDSAHGRVSLHEGEVAAEPAPDGSHLTVGVFHGTATVHRGEPSQPFVLASRDAVSFGSERRLRTLAFPFEAFHRRFPSRELTWKAPAESFRPVEIEHDLSGLVWRPGAYRVYLKWMHGADALIVHSAELRCDGEAVATDVHPGLVGDRHHTTANLYRFSIDRDDYRRGKWTLALRVQTNPRHLRQVQVSEEFLPGDGEVLRADDPRLAAARRQVLRTITAQPDSHGILLVDEGAPATVADYCGTWSYTHNGKPYQRRFFPDGTARFVDGGEARNNFDRSTWTVESGILVLTIRHPHNGALNCIERHLLRGDDTLVFLDRPYRSARRAAGEGGK